MERTQDVSLTIIHKMSFQDFFFFLIPALFDQSRTTKGRPQDVVCQLGNCFYNIFYHVVIPKPYNNDRKAFLNALNKSAAIVILSSDFFLAKFCIFQEN